MAMDDVAFDFMDAIAPGCTVMFPYDGTVSYMNWRTTELSGYIWRNMLGMSHKNICSTMPQRVRSPRLKRQLESVSTPRGF